MKLVSSFAIIIIISMIFSPVWFIETQKGENRQREGDQLPSQKVIEIIDINLSEDTLENQIYAFSISEKIPDQVRISPQFSIEGNSQYDPELKSSGLNIPSPIISIQETNPPYFQPPLPTDITYEMGSTGNAISWKVKDNDGNAFTYEAYVNGEILINTTWSNGFVNVDVNGLALGIWNITAVFSDTFGNTVTGVQYVTVVDTTAPSVIGPADLTYTEGISGNFLSWNATDLNEGNYQIFRNGTYVDSGPWTNPGNITINVDGLSSSNYVYTLNASDSSGNLVSDSVLVVVEDNPDLPSFSLVPGNTTISELSNGNYITWNATDNVPDNYTVYQDGDINSTGTWSNAANISINLDVLGIGIYNFTILLADFDGNILVNTIFVTVSDQTIPSINTTPGNQIIVEDSINNLLSWDVDDLHNNTYEIKRDTVIIASGNWNAGETISIYIDNLAIGIYSFELIIYDEAGNQASDIVTVGVQDLTNPIIENSSGNISYDELEINNEVFWNATDKYAGTYEIYQNGSLVDSGTWTNVTDIRLNVDGLIASNYNFTLIALDLYGNQLVDTLYVFVIDIISPSYGIGPGNQSYAEGTPTLFVSWTATDANPNRYNIYQDGILVGLGYWISGTPVSYNIGGFSQGIYNITIFFYDVSSNYVSNIIFVTVDDTNPPLITSAPNNYDYSEGTSGNKLDWIATDNHPDYYEIYREGSLVETKNWFSLATISLDIDGLSIGAYNYTIFVYDTSGNVERNQANVTVSSVPVFSTVPTITTYLNNSVNILTWIANDADPNTYSIYRNDSLVDSGNWFNAIPITYDITSLLLGLHNITIFVTDASAGETRYTIWITISDMPVLQDSPGGTISYSEGTSSKVLNWTVTDAMADWYYIYFNEAPLQNGSWTSGIEIAIDVGDLLRGTYNYTILFKDLNGNQLVDVLILTVSDDLSPNIVTQPSPTISFNQGDSNQLLTWNATDNYADYYVILKNGSNYKSGSWTNSTLLMINIDDLTYGIYNLTIFIFDESNNSITDEITVTVFDSSLPIVNDSTNFSYSEGSSGHVIIWTATDLNPLNYSVTIEGSFYENGTWISGQNLEINIDGLAIGTYEFEVTFFDIALNSNTDVVSITVVDSTAPSMLFPGDKSYNEGTTGNFISWIVTDSNTANYTAYVNGSLGLVLIDFGNWNSGTPISLDIDGFAFGWYVITLVVNDTAGNFNNQTVLLEVTDSVLPTITPVNDINYEELSQGNNIQWDVDDKNPGYYQITVDSFNRESGVWISSTDITFDIDDLQLGSHIITIRITDSSGNEATDSVTVNVVDTTIPIFFTTPSISSFSESNSPKIIGWNIGDNNPGSYAIYLNGSEKVNSTWSSNPLIVQRDLDIDLLSKGFYNYTIIIVDRYGNENFHTLIVSIFDDAAPKFIIDATPPVQYFEENTGYSLIWTPSDQYNSTYAFYIDEIEMQSGIWNSGIPFALSIDGLLKGSHNITLIIYDESFNFAVSEKIILVLDNIAPSLQSVPDNLEIVEGTSGNIAIWNIIERYPGTYQILINGIIVDDDLWAENVTYSLDELQWGTYNLSIIIFDSSLNSIIHSLNVIVIDKTSPIFVKELIDISYIVNSTGNLIIINVFDNNPDSYILERNNALLGSGAWTNNVPITRNIDGLDFGKYNFTFTLFDKSGNQLIGTIKVKVTSPFITETTPPIFEITDVVFEGDLEIITENWYDINGLPISDGSIEIRLLDGKGSEPISGIYPTDTAGSFRINLNYTLISGNKSYIWEISFKKTGFETQILQYNVEVRNHSYMIELSAIHNIVKGKAYTISATVRYNDFRPNLESSTSALGLSEFYPRQGLAENIEITFTIKLTKTDGKQSEITSKSLTKANGVAFIKLDPSDTNNLESVDGISAKIEGTDIGIGTSLDLSLDLLPRVVEPDPNFLERINNFVLDYYLFILAIVFAIIAALIITTIINKKRNDRYKLILEELRYGKTEFEGILSIQAVLITSKGGIPVFEERYEDFDINPTLVAGMSSAISAFFSEFGTSDKLGFETIERAGMSITSHKSQLSTIVVLSSFHQPDMILEQIQDAQRMVENRFQAYFEKSTQINPLNTNKVHEEFKNADFKISLKGRIRIHKRNLRKVLKIKSVSRNLKENLGSLENFAETINNGDNYVSLREIMNHFSDREVKNEDIARIVLLAHKHEVIQSVK